MLAVAKADQGFPSCETCFACGIPQDLKHAKTSLHAANEPAVSTDLVCRMYRGLRAVGVADGIPKIHCRHHRGTNRYLGRMEAAPCVYENDECRDRARMCLQRQHQAAAREESAICDAVMKQVIRKLWDYLDHSQCYRILSHWHSHFR